MTCLSSSLILLVVFALAVPCGNASPQSAPVIKDPAEYNAYIGAIQQKDPALQISAFENFLAQYPSTVMRATTLQVLMGDYQQTNNMSKTVDTAIQLLAVDPDNIRALVMLAYIDRAKAQNDPNARQELAEAKKYGQMGLEALPKFNKPAGTSDADFQRTRDQMAGIFNAAVGLAALNDKDYATARTALRLATDINPRDFAVVYPLALAYVGPTPADPGVAPDPVNALWFIARACTLAPTAQAPQLETYGKSLYTKFRGSEQGWADLLASAKASDSPPQCSRLDDAVKIEDAMPSGPGHCAGESDYWFTNTSGQAIDCAIIFHKHGRFDPSSALNFSLAPGEKSGGTGKISSCGADSGQMMYQCFSRTQNTAANCTGQIKWQ
jgi:hypothetical protein